MTTMGKRFSAWIVWLGLAAAIAGGAPGCSECNLRISTVALPDGIVGVAYTAGLNSVCGGNVWFLPAGSSLPPGIGLTSAGVLRGVPQSAGAFSFSVAVFDYDSGQTAYRGLSLTVAPGAATPTPTPLP